MDQSKVNEKWAFQILVGVVIASVSGLLGYRFGSSYSHGGNYSSRFPASHCSQSSSRTSFGAFQDGILSQSGPESDYEGVLKKYNLEERNRKVSALFVDTEVGRALVQRVTLLGLSVDGNTLESRVITEAMKLIESEPAHSYALIRNAIKNLAPDQGPERLYLIQLVGKLDLDFTEKLNFLTEELTRQPKKSEAKYNQLSHAGALTTLIHIGADPAFIEASLRQALSSQMPYGLRELLLGVFEAKYPDPGKRMREDLGL
jgi:hypothetical protein